MSKDTLPPPTPEVQYLPTLLRRVQAGEIRVPAFQRGYVWTDKQVLDLLESVFNGYPVGSLLFWQADGPEVKVKLDSEFPLPQSEDSRPATYILDGQQRLATLYNCLQYRDYDTPHRYNVTFDLRKRTFQHHRRGDNISGRIHLGMLFAPRAFLEAQQRLAKEPDAEQLIDTSILLHTIFQEYMIPTVTIKRRDMSDVVTIFERINSTGVRLSAVDFMRAVTWSGDFDLANETTRLSSEMSKEGFQIPSETLVKIVAISLGSDPTPDSMLKLREASASQLHKATKETSRALRRSIEFLKNKLKIFSYDYVPYEAQMLVIAKLFLATKQKPTTSAITTLQRWFWATSLTEALQGKADSVVASTIRSIDALLVGNEHVFDTRIDVKPEDLVRRKFIVRRALSSALAILFAQGHARSIVTGEEIPAEVFMSFFGANHYVPIIEPDKLGESQEGARLVPNMLLASDEDRLAFRKKSPEEYIKDLQQKGGPKEVEILSSQLLSDESILHLFKEDYKHFLLTRAALLIGAGETAFNK